MGFGDRTSHLAEAGNLTGVSHPLYTVQLDFLLDVCSWTSSGGGNFLHVAIMCLCILKGSLIPQIILSHSHPVLAFPIKKVMSDARIAFSFLSPSHEFTASFRDLMNNSRSC